MTTGALQQSESNPPGGEALTLPTLPRVSERWNFPLIGSVAPLLLSVGMWLVTQSVMALVFAGLAPVMAVGSYLDARIKARKKLHSERTRFAAELQRSVAHGERLHGHERARRDTALPSASRIISGGIHPHAKWRSVPRRDVELSLGRGAQQSSIDQQGIRPRPIPESPEEAALAALVGALGRIDDVPVSLRLTLDTMAGAIGVVGAEPLASAYARSLVVQIVRVLSPSRYGISVNSTAALWSWLDELPHPTLRKREGSSVAGRVDLRIEPLANRSGTAGSAPPGPTQTNEQAVMIFIASSREELPGELDAIVSLGASLGPNRSSSLILHHRSSASQGALTIEVVSVEQAAQWARGLTSLAEREGFVQKRDGALPTRVELRDLIARTVAPADGGTSGAPPVPPTLTSLACSFAVGPDSDEIVDLIADGPHAIVGGTTGSGKSELLISWVVAIAARYRPEAVNFLLVDYKGGASFGGLTGLPHCVGMLTDLDDAASKRALASLAAELRFRERALARATAKSIIDNPAAHGLARLVIVVDEFAAMASEHPELHALFSDIAARGRSLGVHLILCTQRPAGVIREAVLANSALRISLRVNNRADSVAVVGDDSAAHLAVRNVGRAVLARAGEPPRVVQCALADEKDTETSPAADPGWQPRRPWLDPLADNIPLEPLLVNAEGSATTDGEISIVFGVADLPQSQEQPPATYQPHRHGHLLVIGDPHSGKSVAVDTLARAARMLPELETVLVASGVEALWDAVTRELARVRESQPGRRLVLIDDLDALLPRVGLDHERELTERLCQLIREGPSAGVHCVIAMRRVSGSASSVANLMGARLVLSHASRQEFILAGGNGNHYGSHLVPGRALWQEQLAQIAVPTPGWAQAQAPASVATSLDFGTSGSFAVVAADPVAAAMQLRDRLSALGGDHEILELGPTFTPGGADLTVTIGGRPRVIIGSPESWQSLWGAIEAISAQWPVAIVGCTASEYRSVTRARALPPPLEKAPEYWWLVRPGLPVTRARFTPLTLDR